MHVGRRYKSVSQVLCIGFTESAVHVYMSAIMFTDFHKVTIESYHIFRWMQRCNISSTPFHI